MPPVGNTPDRVQRIAAIVGMACVWPSIHNQILYPLTFAFNKEGMPSLFAHYVLYAIALLAVVMVITALLSASSRLFASRKTMAALGAVGAAGMVLLVTCSFGSIAQDVLFAAGIVLYALFVPTHFIFWSCTLANASEKRVGFDLLLSYLLFCGVTLLRLALGIHAWPFAIAYPLVSGALAWASANRGVLESYPLRQSSLRDFPYRQLGIATLFVYIASVSVWLLNSPDALFNYPPQNRILMYVAAALAVGILCMLFRPRAHLRSKADLVSFVLCTVFLVLGFLVSGLGEYLGIGIGNFPLLAAKIVFELFIWVRFLVHAQAKHLGVVRPAAFYLVFVIGGSNLLTTMLLFGNQLTLIDASAVPTLAITIVSAVIILIVINVVTLVMLARHVDNARTPDAPCEAAIERLVAEEDALQRICATYGLSQRESDTLRRAVQSKSAKAIAEELYVAESTVNSHIKSIYRKTDVHSRADLIALVNRFRKEDGTRQ